MKLKVFLLVLAALSTFTLPNLSFAQVTGTYDECRAEFTARLSAWTSTIVEETTDAFCATSNGLTTLSVFGKSDSALLIADRLLEIEAYRGQAGKLCILTFREISGGYIPPNYSRGLTGKDFSKWNRYLKGAGCLDVLALRPD